MWSPCFLSVTSQVGGGFRDEEKWCLEKARAFKDQAGEVVLSGGRRPVFEEQVNRVDARQRSRGRTKHGFDKKF